MDRFPSGKEVTRWAQTKDRTGADRLLLGPYYTYIVRNTPRRLLYHLSHHKFAAKMIGPGKRVMDVGCSEGFGTLLLAEFAAGCLGVDSDADAIAMAQATVGSDKLSFLCADIMQGALGAFDAVVSLDVIEHIYPENEERFLTAVVEQLVEGGMFICGTPNITSDQYASAFTKSGHVNLYSAERLRESLQRHFATVLMFSANDEVIHTGFAPMAQYLLGIGIAPHSKKMKP